jgi:hypothetical protein
VKYFYYDETLYRHPDDAAIYDRWMGTALGWVPAVGEKLALSEEEWLHIGEISEQNARDLKPGAFSE